MNRPSMILANSPRESSLLIPGEVQGWQKLEASADGKGGAPTCEILAYTGGMLRLPKLSPHPIVVDLKGVVPLKEKVSLFAEHEEAIGHIESLRIGPDSITATGVISFTTERAQQVIAASKNGFPWQASIGGVPVERQFIAAGQSVNVNGRTFQGPVVVARKTLLREISLVDLGADVQTAARIAAGADPMTFDEWLKAMGLELATLGDDQRAKLQAKYDAEQQALAANNQQQAGGAANGGAGDAAPSPEDLIQASRKAQADEARRVAGIQELAAKFGSPKMKVDGGQEVLIAAHAIEQGWTVDSAHLRMLENSKPRVPAAGTSRNSPSSMKVLEAAMCLTLMPMLGGEKPLLASYGEQTLDQADRFRKLGLRRTIERAAQMQGIDLPDDVGTEWMRAAFSSADISGIVGNVANKAMSATFQAGRTAIPAIARAVTHTNFQIHTVYSLALSGDIEQIAPTGEIKHLSLGEESRTRQVVGRGALLRLSREMIVNDDMAALADMGQGMARKCFVAREKAMFKLFNATGAGASFFTAAHANYVDGAGSALSVAALTTAVQKFREQTGPDGDPVMIEPRLLLVSTDLEETALALMRTDARLIAVALGSTSGKVKEPDANVWAGRFNVVVSEWLNKTISGTAGSTTAWYLLGDPNDVPVCEVAYLNGVQVPAVEYFGMEADPNTVGVTWRVLFDFGVALAEYRAGVKSKGAA